jgi:hypothetical protein
VDLMCRLPNKFPLPVHLLINKCDLIERCKRSPWLEKIQIENYVKENQFFNFYFTSAAKGGELNRDSSLSCQSVEVESPLKDMIRSILQFRDLKEKILSNRVTCKIVSSKTNFIKESTNNSTTSNQSDISFKREDKKKNKSRDKNKGESCIIL